MVKWSKEEIEFLKRNYLDMNYIDISKKIGRSIQSIYWKAYELRLNKGRWNNDNRLTQKKVIEMLLKESKRLGKSPSVREVPISLKSACQRHFGSFNNAKEVADLDLTQPIKFLLKTSYEPSEDLAYILGLILGDGSFRYQKSKDRTSYVVVYATKDKELMDFFLDKFERWAGFNPGKVSIIKGGHKKFPKGNYSFYKKAYYVQICSRDAWVFLKQFKDNPRLCLTFFPKNSQKWLLKGLWDAEGCIRVPRPRSLRIHFSNSDKNILDLYKRLLENFNFKYSIHDVGGCFNIDLLGQSEMKRFIKLIKGITIKRKAEIFNLEFNKK